jgi:hypothetical protein
MLQQQLRTLRVPLRDAFETHPSERMKILERFKAGEALNPEFAAWVQKTISNLPGASGPEIAAALEHRGLLDFVLAVGQPLLGVEAPEFLEKANSLYLLVSFDIPHAREDEQEALTTNIQDWLRRKGLIQKEIAAVQERLGADKDRRTSIENRAPLLRATGFSPYTQQEGPAPLITHFAGHHPTAGQTRWVSSARFEHARESLQAWAMKAQVASLPGAAELPALASLLVTRRTNIETEEGKLGVQALMDLGFIGKFNLEILQLLVADVKTHFLDKTHILYNGHATQEMFGLKPTFDVLGAQSFEASFMPSSGTDEMEQMYREQLYGAGVSRLTLSCG